jgi:hypothetical protein
MPTRVLTKQFHLRIVTATLLYLAPSAVSEESAPTPNQYETPGPVKAEDFLPKSVFAGKKIFVEKTAENNGLQNTYRMKAGAWQELKAINQLRQISTAKAFKNGLKQSVKATYDTGKEIVRNPIGTVKKVPEGASRFFGKVKGFLSQDQDESDQESSPTEAIKGFLGVDDAKRKLAARLGVDVYSRNQTLQEELDRVASAIAGGGVAFDIGTLPIGRAAGIGLTAIGIQQTVDGLINDSSQDSLRKWNEQKLSQLGANRDVITEFVNHPWYTLRQQTIITTALSKTEIDPTIFLEAANKALTDEDGRYFENVAELLAAYVQKATPLQSFRLQDGLIYAVDRNGVLVVPVSLDYAIWTATVAQRVDSLAGLIGRDPDIKSVQIWTDGQASERIKAELIKRAIGYKSISLIKAN